MRVKSNRSLIAYIVLSIITCGIYELYYIYALARDVNEICDGDEDYTPGLLAFLVLSLLTCGFYSFYWHYKLGNRLYNNSSRYGLDFSETGTTVLLWMVLGSLLCGLGTLYAEYIIIKNTNSMADAYNG